MFSSAPVAFLCTRMSFDEFVLVRVAPDDRIVGILEQEQNRLQGVSVDLSDICPRLLEAACAMV